MSNTSEENSYRVESACDVDQNEVDESAVVPVALDAKKQISINQIASRNNEEFSWIGVDNPGVSEFSTSQSSEDENVSFELQEDTIVEDVSATVQCSAPSGFLVNEDIVLPTKKETKVDVDNLVSTLSDSKTVPVRAAPAVDVQATLTTDSPNVRVSGDFATDKSSPAENRKVKQSSGGTGVFGFFQRKTKNGAADGSGSGDSIDSDKRKKSNSLDKKSIIVGEDIILSQSPHGATLPADSRNNGFQYKFGFSGGKEKTTSDDDIESPDAANALAKKPRPHSADVKAGCKSPSKTNLRIFEIMANNPAAVAGPNVSSVNGPRSQDSSTVSAPTTTVRSPAAATGQPSNVPCDIQNRTTDGIQSPLNETVEVCWDKASQQPLQQTISSDDPTSTKNNLPYIVAVAIDFGTTFSGYAFSFTHEVNSTTAVDQGSGLPSVHMMGKWEGGDPGVINQKTPSTLLLSPDGKFHSFGFAARNFYHDLSPEDADQWLYFDKFKMTLYHSSECNTSTMIEAANGQRFSALKAVSMTLGFFKQHALKELSIQCGTQIVNEDVRWIVSVPAIWNSQAKQFMRLAAYEAGLASSSDPGQLLIALEPEAASIHIRRLRMHQLVPDKPIRRPLSIRTDNNEFPVDIERVTGKFNKRTIRYMVVDCGGGTVDITVHELDTATGTLSELHKAAGGPHGSCGIDVEFEKLLDEIFGAEQIQKFRRKRPAGWVCLMTAFESRKRAADPFKMNVLNIPLPFSFIDFYRKHSKTTVEAAINKYSDKDIRWSSQGMLRLTQEAMKKLFQPTLDNIRHIVADVLDHPRLEGVQFVFMVGGLSESAVVQKDIRESFGKRVQVLVPNEASLAVLKGAVSFGLDQTVVAVRRSRLTYGAAVLKRFVRGRHPESKLLQRSGIDWCRDIFDPYVVADQLVHQGEIVVRRYAPASASQTYISITIFSSQHPSPTYTTDEGVSRCATLRLDLPAITSPGSQKARVIEARMTFADTEVSVAAVDTITGQTVNASIDFFDA